MKQKILDLIIAAKRTDPETGNFAEWLAEYLVANGVTVQRWIPIEERLPTNDDAIRNGCVLALGTDGLAGDWHFHNIQLHPEWFTHWMPLPEPPGKDVTADA